MKKNIKNMKDVLDVLLKRDYEIIEITPKIECVEYIPYCEDCGREGETLRLYYDKTTGVIIENYQEQIEIKKEIKELQEQLRILQERSEEDEDI